MLAMISIFGCVYVCVCMHAYVCVYCACCDPWMVAISFIPLAIPEGGMCLLDDDYGQDFDFYDYYDYGDYSFDNYYEDDYYYDFDFDFEDDKEDIFQSVLFLMDSAMVCTVHYLDSMHINCMTIILHPGICRKGVPKTSSLQKSQQYCKHMSEQNR